MKLFEKNIKEVLDYLLFHKEWESIYHKVMNLQTHPNINHKLKFKCMDILDFVKNHTR